MKRLLLGWTTALALALGTGPSHAQVQWAGNKVISLDADGITADVGDEVTAWTNTVGSGGDFVTAQVGVWVDVPRLESINAGQTGVAKKVVRFSPGARDGNASVLKWEQSAPDSITGPSSFSAEGWVYQEGSLAWTQAWFGWGDRNQGGSVGLGITQNSWALGTGDTLFAPTPFPAWGPGAPTGVGQFYYYATVYDSVNMSASFYVNGVLNREIPVTQYDKALASTVYVGCFGRDGTATPGYALEGAVAKVRVHDGVLSATQVLNNFNLEKLDFQFKSSAADILTFGGVPGTGGVLFSGPELTDMTWYVPRSMNVAALAPAYTVSPFATGAPPSGTSRNFSTPQQYTVTAEDGSTKVYTVTVIKADISPLINVNFDTTLRTEELFVGPSGGLETAWNQFGLAGPGQIGNASSANNLLDSAGVPTAVGFTLDANAIYDWGSPNLQLLNSGAFIFGTGGGTLVINGLDNARKYDLYIASFYPNESGCLGSFSTTNETSNGQSQHLDNGVDANQPGWVGNSDTWVQGSNYVRFADVVPVGGRIVVQGIPDPKTERNWNPNLHYNGFQLLDMSGAPPAAEILTFDFPGLPAGTISGTDITLTVPYGTPVSALAPTITISDGARCVPASGVTRDFSDPVTYTVTSSDGVVVQVYTVTVTVTPASTAADILTFGLPELPAVIDQSEASIAWAVPPGTDLTNLAPEYTSSAFSTGAPLSGTSRNFSTPQTYTITAEDGTTTRVYTVTVKQTDVSPLISVNIDTVAGGRALPAMRSLEGPAGGLGTVWTQALTHIINGTEIWENDLLDSGGRRSTVAFKTDAGSLDPWYEGPPDKPLLLTAAAFNFGGETPYNTEISGLRPGYYDLYIASGYPNESGSQGIFSTSNTTSNGPDQPVDNGVRGGQGGNLSSWGQGVNYVLFHNVEPDPDFKIQFAAVGVLGARCMLSGFQLVWNQTATVFTGKDIRSFVIPGNGLPDMPGVIDGTEITLEVPFDTDVTALAPTYTMSPMATGEPASGEVVDFTDPVDYTVTAEDGTTKTYTVTVVTFVGGTPFHRGDANDDGTVNITDGIYVLNYLFLGGPGPTCLEAANANDDAQLNITDGIYILNYLFLGGPTPPAPGPADSPCGEDPLESESRIGCEAYTTC